LNLENFFKDKKTLSPDELSDFLEIARASGKTAFITMVDDPNSPEAKAAEEYINSHHLLPENYKDTTEDEIEARGRKLFNPKTSIEEKKKILMLLAHLGVYESYRILKRYQENPNPELRFWAIMAFDECRTFAQQNLSDETLTALTLIGKIGRNDPCPCGSGRKFKKCCGKRI
jgi:uncharacterized protein YecA (UPF0149 family)